MTDTIDVSDLSPAALLAALYNNSRPQGLGMLHADKKAMTVEEAESLLEVAYHRGVPYFDYLKGRVMKVEINGKRLNPRLYDRDLGPGAALRVVNRLRDETA